jgi:hypothetical protein
MPVPCGTVIPSSLTIPCDSNGNYGNPAVLGMFPVCVAPCAVFVPTIASGAPMLILDKDWPNLSTATTWIMQWPLELKLDANPTRYHLMIILAANGRTYWTYMDNSWVCGYNAPQFMVDIAPQLGLNSSNCGPDSAARKSNSKSEK